jgi:hypothetical protein
MKQRDNIFLLERKTMKVHPESAMVVIFLFCTIGVVSVLGAIAYFSLTIK